MNTLSIKYDPPLEEFEEIFKESIRSPLNKVEKLEKVFGICKKTKEILLKTFFYKLQRKSIIYDRFSQFCLNSRIN